MNISKLTAGKNAPEEINVVVEIPQNSFVKYELDKESGAIMVDRFSFSAFAYPFNYGFVPSTLSGDGDPVDVLVLASHAVVPLTVIRCRPVGLLETEDEKGVDAKIIAVPLDKIDPFYAHIKDIDDVDEATKNKIKNFYEHYKDLEPGKWVKVRNYLPKDKALDEIKKSLK